jgi:hypothetical protein
MRSLPGMVQDWLWLHTWLGVITILIAFLHENYAYVTHDFCSNLSCLTNTYWATGALYSLMLLVVSGVLGRLLDVWQTKVIAHEASSNGIGITRSVIERLRDLEYSVERYCAGKSAAFKQACSLTLVAQGQVPLPSQSMELPAYEHGDWQKTLPMLTSYAQLSLSLRRLQGAQRIIRTWRTIHICLACLTLVVVSYHGIMELLTSVFHILALPG